MSLLYITRFKAQEFYILPTKCISFCIGFPEQRVNISLHIQAHSDLVSKGPSNHFMISHAVLIFKFRKNQPSCSNIKEINFCFNTLRTGDADLRFYVTTLQDGWGRFAFLTRWNSVHLQVLISATPQGGMFPEVSHPQALLGFLVSISWKFQFTKIVSEFVINF